MSPASVSTHFITLSKRKDSPLQLSHTPFVLALRANEDEFEVLVFALELLDLLDRWALGERVLELEDLGFQLTTYKHTHIKLRSYKVNGQ